MKLITEHIDQELEVICEAKKNGEKNYFIEGVFMQANQKNKNGRIYEKKILEKAIDKYVTEQVKTGRAVGELNHEDRAEALEPDISFEQYCSERTGT